MEIPCAEWRLYLVPISPALGTRRRPRSHPVLRTMELGVRVGLAMFIVGALLML